MAPSKYSTSIATGSGTDKISIVSNMESKNVLTDAGKHSKLGELIGKCVIEATKCALAKQTNLTPKSQFSMMKRLNRFDIDEEKYWEIATSTYRTDQESEFIKELHYFSQNPLVVAMISSILHIVDEIQWKLIPELTGKKTALLIMNTLPEVLKIKDFPKNENIITENDSIIESWIKISSWCILNSS
jgi:adenosylcobinamide hydrolase